MSFLRPVTFCQQFVRQIGKAKGRRQYKWKDEPGAIKCHGFTYYPRNPEFKLPPHEPSKLFRVQRIKPLKGCPYWEKDILKQLRLDGFGHPVSVVKNIPEMNAMLWRVKHLIKIDPITFPNGPPEDSNGAFLKENGELVVARRLQPEESRVVAFEQFVKDTKKLDGDTLRRDSRKKWNNGYTSMVF